MDSIEYHERLKFIANASIAGMFVNMCVFGFFVGYCVVTHSPWALLCSIIFLILFICSSALVMYISNLEEWMVI